MVRFSRVAATVVFVGLAFAVLVGCDSGGSRLEGTQWRLVGWTVSSIDPANVMITAEFAQDRLSGNSGVNSYSGPYKLGPGDTFAGGPFAGTLMAGPEPTMRAESAYLQLLGQAKSYKVSHGTLTLYEEGGNESLTFEAAN